MEVPRAGMKALSDVCARVPNVWNYGSKSGQKARPLPHPPSIVTLTRNSNLLSAKEITPEPMEAAEGQE